MAEQGEIKSQNRDIKNGEYIPLKEDLAVEILKEGKDCPNCHFARLVREDNQILCPICGYGRKACT